MKTVLELAVWTLLLTFQPSKQECSTDVQFNGLRKPTTSFRCTNTNFEHFLYDFIDSLGENIILSSRHNEIYNLVITNSDFAHIHSFALPLSEKLREFSLTNSSLETIGDHAFEEFVNMTRLDLSHNNLRDVSFIRTLPSRIETLLLNDNNFQTIRNVFDNLPSLKHLDLSNCRLNIIDSHSFATFTKEVFINLKNNTLTSFDLFFEDGLRLEVDLSFNNIKHIDTQTNRIYFRSLNASCNKIETINDISCQDCGYHYYRRTINIIDLSFNDLSKTNFLNSFNGVKVETLNLSNANIGENFDFETCQKYVKKKLDLSNNNIGLIKPKMFGEHFHLTQLSLFNSSITNISAKGFSDCSVNILNISSNLLTQLKNRTFDNCRISKLDISKCLIKTIEEDAFLDLHLSHTLDLSHNQISYIHVRTFQNLSNVDIIDLSFNFLKVIEDDWFSGCYDLKVLYLSNSKVETIRSQAFSGSMELRELHLDHNSIQIVDFDSRSIIGVVNLQNNRIDNLVLSFLFTSSAVVVLLNNNDILCNLTNNSIIGTTFVEELNLSNSHIINIDSDAFRGLRSLRALDLSNNDLRTINPETFYSLKKLKRLDLTGNDIVAFSQQAFAFGNRLEELAISFAANILPRNTFVTFNYVKTINISDSKALSLEENSFNGLINLETLNLRKLDIVQISPGAFNRLKNLRSNNFQTLFKHIHVIKTGTFVGLPKLNILDLSVLNITSIEAEAFVGLTSLKKLSLHHNQLKNITNDSFSGLSSLKTLDLSHNVISTLEPNAFFGLVNLDTLSLSNNNITKLALGTFQEFPNLRVMSLRQNFINKLLTGTFSNLKVLKELDLSYNNVTRLKMQNLIPLIELKRLDLTGNHLIAISHLDLIKSLRHLEFIGINGNKWKCDNLATMLIAFRNSSINWVSSESLIFKHENIEGIKCYNICKFFYCADEADSLWREETHF